jgi:hypothetical protein
VKFFTIAEAEALIPQIEKIYETVVELAAQAEMKAAALRRREDGGDADPAASAIERSQLQFLAQRINETLQTIVELGAFPKGVQPALVDFPHRLDGRDVYLCWRLGDKRLTHYHGVDEGFSGRKPLPRRKSA